MKVFLKYHIPLKLVTNNNFTRLPYWYIGIKFNATDQLYNLDLQNESNDFYKNIKIGNTIETYMHLFKTSKQIIKKLTISSIMRLYDNCLMRIGNLYNSENTFNIVGTSNELSDEVPIRYSMAYYSFIEDPCIYSLDVPLKNLSLDRYKYDFRSWMIHRSIQELN